MAVLSPSAPPNPSSLRSFRNDPLCKFDSVDGKNQPRQVVFGAKKHQSTISEVSKLTKSTLFGIVPARPKTSELSTGSARTILCSRIVQNATRTKLLRESPSESTVFPHELHRSCGKFLGRWDAWDKRSRGRSELVLTKVIAQRALADTQQRGGFFLATVCLFQAVQDRLARDPAEVLVQIQRRQRRSGRSSFSQPA